MKTFSELAAEIRIAAKNSPVPLWVDRILTAMCERGEELERRVVALEKKADDWPR